MRSTGKSRKGGTGRFKTSFLAEARKLGLVRALSGSRDLGTNRTLSNNRRRDVGAIKSPAMKFTRITVDAKQMGGVPCLRGLRIPVATVVGMVADGMAREEILRAYPDLEAEDIDEALRYAAAAVRERELPLSAK